VQSPHDEIVQIVNRDNVETGTAKRSVMREEGLTHRATYILVFNSRNELFLQKRTMTKDIYPGHWDVAAGGVVLAGESYAVSAERELLEELGVRDGELHYCFDYYYEDSANKVWGAVFSCRHEGPFILQEEEISGGKFMAVPDVFELSNLEPFTPDGLDILRLYSEKEGLL